MNYQELRKEGREALKGKWGVVVVAYLILTLLPVASEGIFMWFGSLSILGTIAMILIKGPLDYSYTRMMMNTHRGEKVETGDVFYGFNEFSRTVMAGVDIYVRTFLWTLLFIIPGIIAAYSYSMTYYIMVDNPAMQSGEAIQKSKEMMRGHKAELFVLDLTFIGWMLLCILTFGIGYLWLGPYMASTRVSFYNKLKPATSLAQETDGVLVVDGSSEKPFNEDSDAKVLYDLKCTSCGAKSTHTQPKTNCPYCSGEMIEDK